jgi:hypothetical protein
VFESDPLHQETAFLGSPISGESADPRDDPTGKVLGEVSWASTTTTVPNVLLGSRKEGVLEDREPSEVFRASMWRQVVRRISCKWWTWGIFEKRHPACSHAEVRYFRWRNELSNQTVFEAVRPQYLRHEAIAEIVLTPS